MTRVPCDRCGAMVPHQNLSQHHAGHKCGVAQLRRRAVEEGWTAPTLSAGRGVVQRLLHNAAGLTGGLAIYTSQGNIRTPRWVSAVVDAYVRHVATGPTMTPEVYVEEVRELLRRLQVEPESERQRLVVLALGGPASTLAYLQATELLTDLRPPSVTP